MKKLWSYISAVLAGIIVGIILWEHIDSVDFKHTYNGKVKIKQKGKGNVQDTDLTVTVKEARQMRRKLRKERREEKRKEVKDAH